MTQVRRDVDVDSTGPYGIELVVPGSSYYGHPTHESIGWTCHPDATSSPGERCGEVLHELPQGLRSPQRADPSDACPRFTLQGTDVDQGAGLGKGITDAR